MASDSGTVEPVDSDPVAVGDLVDGRYRIEELIARGGQASVWRARQEPLQRSVALKVLTAPPTREGSEPFRERFLLEAKTLASLNHPNIVIVYDYGRISPGCYYIAMEHVEGVRFSRILRERPIDAARRLRLVSQVCNETSRTPTSSSARTPPGSRRSRSSTSGSSSSWSPTRASPRRV